MKKPNYVLVLGEPSSNIIKKYLEKYSLLKQLMKNIISIVYIKIKYHLLKNTFNHNVL